MPTSFMFYELMHTFVYLEQSCSPGDYHLFKRTELCLLQVVTYNVEVVQNTDKTPFKPLSSNKEPIGSNYLRGLSDHPAVI